MIKTRGIALKIPSLFIFPILYFGLLFQIRSQQIIWANSIGGPFADIVYASVIDKAGNIHLCGAFKDSMDFAPREETFYLHNNNFYSSYEVLLDPNGKLINAIKFDGDNSRARVIAVDNSLNYYIAGTFDNFFDADPGPDSLIFTSNAVADDIYFQKFDKNDQLQWAFQLVTHGDLDALMDIAIDDSLNVYTSGCFHGTTDFDPGSTVYEMTSIGQRDLFIQKIDPDGNLIWAKHIGGGYETSAEKIAVDRAGNLLISGIFKGSVDFDPGPDSAILYSSGVFDAFIMKLSSNGSLVWAKNFGGGGNEYINDMKIDNDQNILIGGSFRYTADFDPDPDIQFMVEGGQWSDLYLLKLDNNGVFNWVRTLGNSTAVFIREFAIDSLNNIYFGSNFKEPLDIFPGDSVIMYEPIGSFDYFIEKLSPEGDYVFSAVIGSQDEEFLRTVLLGNQSNILAVGTFTGTPEYQLNNSWSSLEAEGEDDIFIAKLSQETSGVQKNIINLATVFPNPCKGKFFIGTRQKINKEDITLFDLSGRKIPFILSGQPNLLEINLINEFNGVVITEIVTANICAVCKIIVR